MPARESPGSYADDESEGSLRGYISIVRRHRLAIAFLVVAVPVGAVALALRQAPLYRATSDVLISQQDVASSLLGAPQPTTSAERFAQTQRQLARVPAVASRAIRLSGLGQRNVDSFLASSDVTVDAGSDILKFSASDRSASVASTLATAYARAFVKYRRQLDTAAFRRARLDVSTRLQQLRANGQQAGALYASLADKEQQLRTLEVIQTANATVVRTAGPGSKIRPRPLLYGGLGLFAGLLVGLVFAFGSEALDTRVRSVDDLVTRLGLPLLGRVRTPNPRRKLRRRKTGLPLMIAQPTTADAEAFRRLRTGVDLANLGHQARSLLITSGLPEEGKSIVAANLAVAFARATRHVILVDLDLRDPSLGDMFGLAATPGLTDCVLGQATLDNALNRIALGRDERSDRALADGSLDVLVAGTLPPDPGEFIEAAAVNRWLGQLAARCDVLLIDSPPLLSVGDAASLSRRVEGLILVARPSMLSRSMVAELRRILGSSPAIPLGVVATGVDAAFASGYPQYPAVARYSEEARR